MNQPKKDVAAELRLLAEEVQKADSKTPESRLNDFADRLMAIRTARLSYEKKRIELLLQLLPILREKKTERVDKVAWFLLRNHDATFGERKHALRVFLKLG